MRRDEFVDRYGGVYEHSRWVAEEAYDRGLNDLASLAEQFAAIVDEAPRERRLALIRAHPDLAGRAAVAGELTDASAEEQQRARLDCCTPGEYRRFQAFRNRDRAEILAAFEARIANDPGTEFDTAIAEIHEIARMRLETL